MERGQANAALCVRYILRDTEHGALEQPVIFEARRVVTALLDALQNTEHGTSITWDKDGNRVVTPLEPPAVARPEPGPSVAAIEAAVEAKYAALGRDDVHGDHDVMREVLSAAYAVDAARPLASSLTVERLTKLLAEWERAETDGIPVMTDRYHREMAEWLLPRLAGPAQEGPRE